MAVHAGMHGGKAGKFGIGLWHGGVEKSRLGHHVAGQGWNGGLPSDERLSRHYFIGALLGYTGLRGNTPEELIAMIDRSIAADGSHPNGTFYFMETSDSARSGPVAKGANARRIGPRPARLWRNLPRCW